MGKKSQKKRLWLKEWFTPHESHSHGIRKYLVHTQTQFQKAIVADTYSFGRCLILDGEMQSSQLDEFIYHESLVHPAMITHPNPKTVLILGGGEGATVRELLKHKSLEQVTMVDIDGEVIEFCKKYLEPWHKGCFSSKKLRLIVGDAKEFIETREEKFDVIISDLPSPIEDGPAYQLYTLEFYRILIQRLNKGGIFVMQAGSGNLLQFELHQVLFSTLQHVFKFVRPFYAHVPSFDVPWAFLISSDSHDPLTLGIDTISKILRKRVKGKLDFYDGTTHLGIFHPPKHIRQLLHGETRAITKKKPIYFYK